MAEISTYLQKIMEAVYGEEVRDSIHDALSAMNEESSDARRFALTAKDSAAASAMEAKVSAATAEQKAEEITGLAQAAKLSEDNARVSEANSAQKANEAVTSAAEAKASETAAGRSEGIATQKAQEAADSQSAAAQSEAEARAAEDRVKTIHSDVETLSAQATAAKEAAEGAKVSAEAAADDAAIAETNAKLSENAALVARTAAEIAKDDAEAAKLAAQTAKTAAQTAADNASTDADDAAQAAADAAASALSAQQYSGKPPKPQDGTWWIWNTEQQKYLDSGIRCELVGPTGNGIRDFSLTKGNHAPGTTDTYTATMTDGSHHDIPIYNGRDGTGTGDVLGIWFNLTLPVFGWVNGELTVADSRFLALASHKYLIGVDGASCEEYLECNVRPKDIDTTGFLTFQCDTIPAADLTVQVIRLELSANGA